MAEFDDIDALLSKSLKSAAEPANSAGVADAIRSRVAAGDAGTSVAGSTAPGWGGGAGGALTWIPWLALVVVAGVAGATLGVTGVFGAPLGEAAGQRPFSAVVDGTVSGLDCPDGSVVSDLYPGQHVLALARTEKSDFIAVRDPAAVDATVWVDAKALRMGDGVEKLPVGGCGELAVQTPTPTPTPTQTQPAPNPSHSTAPPPPKDSTKPTITGISAVPPTVVNNQPAVITVTATDNVAVTSVTLSWANGANVGSVAMPKVGSSWQYSWSNNGPPSTYGNYTFTAIAKDAAGNQSAPAQIVVYQQYLG